MVKKILFLVLVFFREGCKILNTILTEDMFGQKVTLIDESNNIIKHVNMEINLGIFHEVI